MQQITLRNLLSFKDATIDLKPLNILIGENTAGKSNLIEAISLLQAAPLDLRTAVLRGGGIRYWVWLGDGVPDRVARLACWADGVHYSLELAEDAGGMLIPSERLLGPPGVVHLDRKDQSLDFGGSSGYPVGRTESALALFRNPADQTPITRLGKRFESIRIYREFQTGPRAGSRRTRRFWREGPPSVCSTVDRRAKARGIARAPLHSRIRMG